jgi:hypothetical protein
MSQQLGGSPPRLTSWLPTQPLYGRQAEQHAPVEALSGAVGLNIFNVSVIEPRMHCGVGNWHCSPPKAARKRITERKVVMIRILTAKMRG